MERLPFAMIIEPLAQRASIRETLLLQELPTYLVRPGAFDQTSDTVLFGNLSWGAASREIGTGAPLWHVPSQPPRHDRAALHS
jgi:hypothetical protein